LAYVGVLADTVTVYHLWY